MGLLFCLSKAEFNYSENDSLAKRVIYESAEKTDVTLPAAQYVEMFMYSNGYIAKNGADTGLTATLSSDYKTVTLNNTSGQYYYIGILHPDTATMTISAPN